MSNVAKTSSMNGYLMRPLSNPLPLSNRSLTTQPVTSRPLTRDRPTAAPIGLAVAPRPFGPRLPSSGHGTTRLAALARSEPGAPREAPRFHTKEELLQTARTHFLYAARLGPETPFSEAPILEKNAIYEALEADAARPAPTLRESLYWSPSGGTTSSRAFYFPTDVRENAFQRRALVEGMTPFGLFDDATVSINLHSSGGMYRGLEIHNDFVELAGGTSLPLGFDSSDAEVVKAIERWRPNMICAFPTRLMSLATHMDKLDRALSVPKLVTGGDILYPSMKATVARALGIKQFLQIFGSAETGIWAFQPPVLENTTLFAYDPRMMHVEIADADADGVGRIITTNLIRTRVPLLRYDTGDLGRLTEQTLDGSSVPLLDFRGRATRSFQVGGNYYMLKDVERALGLAAEPGEGLDVTAYQLLLTHDRPSREESLTCKVVLAHAARKRDAERILLDRLWTVVPTDAVRVVSMDALERDPRSGKIKKIVDRRA